MLRQFFLYKNVLNTGQNVVIGRWVYVRAEDGDHETAMLMKLSRHSWFSGGYVFPVVVRPGNFEFDFDTDSQSDTHTHKGNDNNCRQKKKKKKNGRVKTEQSQGWREPDLRVRVLVICVSMSTSRSTWLLHESESESEYWLMSTSTSTSTGLWSIFYISSSIAFFNLWKGNPHIFIILGQRSNCPLSM